jgi:hypothetical protein
MRTIAVTAGVAAVAAVGAVGFASLHHGVLSTAEHHSVALTAEGDALLESEAALNASYIDFQLDIQRFIYESFTAQGLGDFLFVDPDASPPYTNVFNGALTRFADANLAGLASYEHGLNAQLGFDTDAHAQALADSLDFKGPTPDGLEDNVLFNADPSDVTADNIGAALADAQSTYAQLGFSDILGAFTQGIDLGGDTGTDTGTAAAESVGLFDLF